MTENTPEYRAHKAAVLATWREKNKERIAEKAKAYRLANPRKHAARSRKYYQNNAEAITAAQREKRIDKPGARSAAMRDYWKRRKGESNAVTL